MWNLFVVYKISIYQVDKRKQYKIVDKKHTKIIDTKIELTATVEKSDEDLLLY